MFAFLGALPQIVSLISAFFQLAKTIWNYVKEWEVEREEKALNQKAQEASQKAVDSKDTSDLENIFRGK